jgi:hypothetical protein
MANKMTINRETQRQLDKLAALEAGGVDNWDFYDDSLKEWRAKNHTDECIDDAIENIHELLVDAEVEYPAGLDAGHSIEFDEDAMFRLLHKLITAVSDE